MSVLLKAAGVLWCAAGGLLVLALARAAAENDDDR